MKIFLASPHTILKFKDGVDLANKLFKGEDMIIYLAGAVSGNLKPAWQRVAKRPDLSFKAFKEELINENFWQGGSQDTSYMTV